MLGRMSAFDPLRTFSFSVKLHSMTFAKEMLDAAHKHTTNHREELEQSSICGCFYCCATFVASDVETWLSEGSGTALCPSCTIDSVIGSASGYPVADPAFLEAMHERWFN